MTAIAAEETTAVSSVAAEELTTPGVKYTLAFDAAFQTKIAALVVRDTSFVQRVDGLIRPEYFDNGVEAAWASVALRYYARYRKVPGDEAIYVNLIKEDIKNRIYDREMALLMLRHLRNVLVKADISDRDHIVDMVAVFARKQAVTGAMTEAIPLIDKADFGEIEARLHKALSVGAHSDGEVYDYAAMIKARTGERLDRASGLIKPDGISTGHPLIDDSLYHKGWGRGELSVLMGGAKVGKTTALTDFGIQALKAGNNVLYVTLEVSAKIIAERMDANITDTPMKELEDRVHDVREKVERFVSTTGKTFAIKEFPTGTMTPSDLRRLIERFKARGIVFDLVIVDYADLMSPERHSDSPIENSKSVYVALRGIAMKEHIALLTATQTNREGYKAAVAKAEHVSEDFNKIRIADVIISINRTDEERAAGQARLFFAAIRNSAGGFTIRVEQRLESMRFISKVVGYE